jgi:DNA-binding transcriptional MocR family regulator
MLSISPPLRLASWASVAQATTIQEMLALTSKPGMLSFALGLPEASLFPAEAFAQSAAQLLVENPQSLQYGPPSQALKMHIVALMHQRGVECHPEQVFLTTGAQHLIM